MSDVLATRVEIVDRMEVRRFLYRNPQLIRLVRAIPIHLAPCFPGDDLKVQLETDPESGTTSLWFLVVTEREPEDALARLTQFDDSWWLDQVDYANGLMGVNIEYR